jgi:hypothetical protein
MLGMVGRQAGGAGAPWKVPPLVIGVKDRVAGQKMQLRRNPRV